MKEVTKTPGRAVIEPPEAAEPMLAGRTMLSVQEVARHLRISKQHVCNLIYDGTLPAINAAIQQNRGRAMWRIPAAAYLAFLKRRSGPA